MRRYRQLAWLVVMGVVTVPPACCAQAEPRKSAEKPVAIVNGEPISRAEFEHMWQRVPTPPAGLKDDQRKALQMELLTVMVDEVLFQQFLRKNVPAPDAALIKQRVAELEASLRTKGWTLEDYYADTGQSETRLKKDIAAVIQWNAYVKKHLSEDDLQRCYEENRELLEGAMIRASHIFLRASRSDDAKAYQAAVQKLQSIRQEIMSGLDFAEAARKYSQDATAAKGGDIGYFAPSRADKNAFIRTASALRVGQVSDVVQADYGCHLIKLTDRKPGVPSTFESAKDDARVLAADDLRAKIVLDQRQKAKIEINLP